MPTLLSARLLVTSFLTFIVCFSSAALAQTYDGKWQVTETISAPECNEATFQETYIATVSQLDTKMTVTAEGITRSGSIIGSQLSFTASYPEDGGTTSSSGTINFSGDTASGGANFTFTRGTTTCGGSTVLEATRLSSEASTPPVGPPPGTPIVALDLVDTTLTVNWSAIPDATGFILYYAPFPDPDPVLSLDVGNQFSVSTALPAGSAFYIAVRAYNAAGEGAFSNIENFTIP